MPAAWSAAQPAPDLLPALSLDAPITAPLPAVSQTVPTYNSLPSANATIYLDFGGDTTSSWGIYDPGTTPAYSIDADLDNFSEQELANIQQIWQRVSEAFSPFKVNVTTAPPPSGLVDGRDVRVVIGGDGKNGRDYYWPGARAGGIGYVGGFVDSDPNSVYVFPNNLGNGAPKYTAMAVAHEVGHAFGLEHQSTYSTFGDRNEYNPGTSERAPFMGNSYRSTRGVWYLGQSTSMFAYQNDASVIASGNNGFGYRDDDHGNTIGSATSLLKSGDVLVGSGVIEITSDADVFKFTVDEASDWLFIVTGAEFGAMLDPSLALYAEDGTLLQFAASSALTETITTSLLPGIYDLAVLSAGAPGDIGQFTLIAVPEPTSLAVLLVPLAVLARRRRR